MRSFEVGKLLEEGITRYNEGVKFDFQQSGPVLLLFFNRPTEKEVESIKKGKLEIGFYVKDEVIFMLFKFQSLEWMDAPYSVHLSNPFTFDDIEPGQGFGLTIFLVDASTGILRALRYSGLSTDFSFKLQDAILNQKNLPFDAVVYNQKFMSIYNNYSTSDLVQRADVFCRIRG